MVDIGKFVDTVDGQVSLERTSLHRSRWPGSGIHHRHGLTVWQGDLHFHVP